MKEDGEPDMNCKNQTACSDKANLIRIRKK